MHTWHDPCLYKLVVPAQNLFYGPEKRTLYFVGTCAVKVATGCQWTGAVANRAGTQGSQREAGAQKVKKEGPIPV